MNLTAANIEHIAAVLKANEGYDSRWTGGRVSKMVLEVGGQRVTLSRISRYAALQVTRIEEVKR